jgi:hypothetical protein
MLLKCVISPAAHARLLWLMLPLTVPAVPAAPAAAAFRPSLPLLLFLMLTLLLFLLLLLLLLLPPFAFSSHQANHEETLRASQELAAKQQELAEARKRQLEALGGTAGALRGVQVQCITTSVSSAAGSRFVTQRLILNSCHAHNTLLTCFWHACMFCAGAAAAGHWPTSPGALAAAGGFGSPGTPGFAAAAAAAAAGAPAATCAGSAAAAAAVANEAPAQIAAALHAQGKTYEDLVHMYADMVRILACCLTTAVSDTCSLSQLALPACGCCCYLVLACSLAINDAYI